MGLRAYIVDDERLAVQRLTRLLDATGRVDVLGSTTDSEEALDFLRRQHAEVDVLFLDVQMPGLTGFELLAHLDCEIPVVFTTAYDRYALNAFEVNSVDYLLKPIDPDRLERALDKVRRRAPGGDVRALARQLAAELTPHRRLDRLASRVGERTTILEVARISHFFARDKLTFAASGGRQHAIEHTLAELEQQLDPRRFARIHRATIVNIAFVQELYPGVEGTIVRLKDEGKTELSVARDRVRELKEKLGILRTND